METVHSLKSLFASRKTLPGPVGFVPTMGSLHEGHLSLVRKARQECSSVVVSIFVNPTQFAPEEDLENYPRDLTGDENLLRREGVDLVWNPSAAEMYPETFQTWVTVADVTQPLEGSRRPTHFRGVTTVVAKLFNAVRPDKAYFGQKDAQQAVVIRQMTRDLNYPIEIVVCPIVREPDGLAMSSRNTYLTPEQREAALSLSRGLSQSEEAFQQGERNADRLREIVAEEIAEEPLAELQYVSCAAPDTLEELEGEIEHCLISLAAFVGKTRLIDNVVLSDSR